MSLSIRWTCAHPFLRVITQRTRVEEIEGALECLLHNGPYLFINGRCRFLGIIPFMRRRWKIGAAQECVRITIIGEVAEFVGHSVACDHAASDVGDTPQVVCSTCRKMTE